VATAGNANSLGWDNLPDSYRWVTAKVAHGMASTLDEATARLFQDVRAEGLRVVPFAWAEEGTVEEAFRHAELAVKVGADALIVNAEDPFENAGFWKSRTYATRLRQLLPDLPMAVSVLGGSAIPAGSDLTPWRRFFDTTPWLELAFDFMPQAYWNMTNPNLPPPGSPKHAYRPANCVRTWELAGVPRGRIRLTYGLWEVPSPVSAAQYVADTPSGCVGFSSYLYEQHPVESSYDKLLEVPHA
jgi:hypothetical protein